MKQTTGMTNKEKQKLWSIHKQFGDLRERHQPFIVFSIIISYLPCFAPSRKKVLLKEKSTILKK